MIPERLSISPAILSGDTADVYFLRSLQILRAEGINPVATMEVFPSGSGVLCGMKEVLALLRQVLPADALVEALEEGAAIQTKEVVLRITAPYQTYCLYETAILGMLAHESGWATAARACVEAANGIPVISFGARHVHPEVAPRLDYAAVVGGCTGCSTPAGARLAGLAAPSGTMPHALILVLGDTVRAAQAFHRWIEPGIPRIVLVDTFKDEAEESLRVAEALGPDLAGVRLDTPSERGRVTFDLVKEVRARLDLAGYRSVKILVSGGLDPARIRAFRESGAPVDGFGVGGYIASAPPLNFTGDLKAIAGRPVAKRGRIPGLTPNPRLQPQPMESNE